MLQVLVRCFAIFMRERTEL